MAVRPSHVDLLAKVDLLRDLDRATLERLLEAMDEVTTPAGHAVFHAGDVGDGLHVIVDGTARVVVHGRPRRDLGPGDVFGEIALVDEGPRSASVYAATELRTLFLPASAFRALLSDGSTARDAIVLGLIRRLRDLEADTWAAEEELHLRQLQTTFVANIGHELRTPLTVALGYVQLARSRPDRPEILGRVLEGAEQGLKHLHELLEDLLDLVLTEQRRVELALGPQPLAAIVDTAVGASGLDPARVEVAGAGGHIVEGDPDRLVRLFVALLDNARKYGPDDGPIAVRASATEDDAVVIDVVDAGPGIAVDDVEHIFDAFVQRDPSATRAKGGMGVGLALARALARLHGGELEVVPDAPTTTFRVTLPRAGVVG